jgi:hypothetical protein
MSIKVTHEIEPVDYALASGPVYEANLLIDDSSQHMGIMVSLKGAKELITKLTNAIKEVENKIDDLERDF